MRIRESLSRRAPLFIRKRLVRRECFRDGGLQVGVGQSLSSAFSLLFFVVLEGIALIDCVARLLAILASYLWLFVGAWAGIERPRAPRPPLLRPRLPLALPPRVSWSRFAGGLPRDSSDLLR